MNKHVENKFYNFRFRKKVSVNNSINIIPSRVVKLDGFIVVGIGPKLGK